MATVRNVSLVFGLIAVAKERCMELVIEVMMVSTHCAWNIVLFVGQELQTWRRCETLRLHLTNLTYTEPALVINSSQQERRLTYLNYVLLEVCVIRKETLGLKTLFIIPTDARNYKIIGMSKTIKFPTIALTCFGLRRNHHQGAISCLAKTTIMILLCSLTL